MRFLLTLLPTTSLLLATASVAQMPYNSGSIAPEYLLHAHSVVREANTVYHITDLDELEIEAAWVVTILDPQGKDEALWIDVENSYSQITFSRATIYDGSGVMVRNNDNAEVRSGSASGEKEFADAHVKLLMMEYPTYPYSVAFKVRKAVKGFFRMEDFVVQRLGQSVENASFTLITPSDYQYKWKGIRTDVKPVEISLKRELSRQWKFEKLPAVENEPNNPFFQNVSSKLVFAPARVKIESFKGDFSTWKTTGDFFYLMNKGRDDVPPSLQQKVTEMTQGKPIREKIEILYRYMKTNCRYVSIQIGIGGWQTFDAAFVDRKKYGDCKALSNYMKTLLKAAGIESNLVVIYAGNGKIPELYDDAPAPRMNHMILYIPSETLWLECTDPFCPVGYLGSFTSGRPALCLTEAGGKLMHTPQPGPKDNQESLQSAIQIEASGKAVVKNKMIATGSLQEEFRQVVARKKKQEQESYFIQNAGFPISRLTAFSMTPDPEKPETILDYQMDVEKYASVTGKRIFIPVNKVHLFKTSLPVNDQRALELQMSTTYLMIDTVEIRLPSGYDVENLPSDKNESTAYGSFVYSFKQASGRITEFRRIEIQPVSVPPSEYKNVRQFYLDLAKADGAQVVLVKKE
jgi:hypothetical protein